MATASLLVDLWNDRISATGREGEFLVLVGFLGAFLFIRTSARLIRSPRVPWWPGSVVTEDGLHIHHLVWGILLMVAAASIGYAIPGEHPWWEITAALFGIGAGLTFDEFALWVNLRDVYWAQEGRRSIDAAVIAASFMGIVFMGAVPFEIDSADAELFALTLGAAVLAVCVSAVCFAKHRVLHGFVGLFVGPIALWGALRLAKPDSPWARRFYGERSPAKQRRAEDRYRHRQVDRLKEGFRDLVGGRTGAG